MGSSVIKIESDEAKRLLVGLGSSAIDIEKVAIEAKEAFMAGDEATKFLQSTSDRGTFYRIIHAKQIRTNMLAAVDANKRMINVNMALTAMTYDQTIQLKETQSRLTDLEKQSSRKFDHIQEFQEKLDEIISNRLGRIENDISNLGGTNIKEELNGIRLAVRHLKEKQDTERSERISSIEGINNKMLHQDIYYTEEFHKRDKKVGENLVSLSRSITKSKNEGIAKVSKLKSSVHIKIVSAVVFMVLLNISGLLFISKKIMTNPAASECIESSVCLIKWLAGL